jgi:subtilisin family serine protease
MRPHLLGLAVVSVLAGCPSPGTPARPGTGVSPAPGGSPATIATPSQWYLEATRGIDIRTAWSLPLRHTADGQKPGTGVTVAIVDTGIDSDHPDLEGNLARVTPAALASPVRPRLRDAAPGAPLVVDEVGGRDAPYAGRDGNGHGTFCAGLIAAVDDGAGIVGVAPGARILAIKAMTSTGDGRDEEIARGILDAVELGADLVNVSVGGSAPSQVLAEAMAEAFRRGCSLVVASGNGAGAVYYPAAYPGVIAVGATAGIPGSPREIPPYSNRGPELTLVAPGGTPELAPTTSIWSTLPTHAYTLSGRLGNTYGRLEGTSFATPLVAGVAALVLAEARARGMSLTPAQLRLHLAATATPLTRNPFDPRSGYGFINPKRALEVLARPGETS